MSNDILLEIKKILENHKGKSNAISSGEIARQLGLKQEDTHVEPRQYILEVIIKYKLPVAGTGKGYYLIANKNELEEYQESLDSRIEKIRFRKAMVTKNFKTYYKKK